MQQRSRGSRFFVYALILSSVSGLVFAQTCDFPVWTNGCSVPLNLPFFYKDKFTTACNHHDMCYHCGFTFGIKRETCDQIFLQNMRQQCSIKHLFSCKYTSALYYKVVRKLASSHYNQRFIPECTLPSVLPCLT
eukprot:XP_011412561.1 PREDICTED: uncharacterized protein LOC105317577 [Crassostrea gigas]